ncbi:hypothetical protein UGMREWDR_CDS0209 [Aeromonas phage GomatiRiver_11]|nr:hypothetical protein OBDJBBDK_00207 [Aeromonas phage AhFM11]WKW84376.1 hypothetical protein UGMREWDR_CDS0209 [Aeromonas phage GomatiRiver_11]
MKFAPGTVIPEGYVIKITSWENDGDDYADILHTGRPMKDIEFFEKIKPIFKSRHNSKRRGYGNGDYNPEMAADLFEIFVENTHLSAQFKHYLGLTPDMYDSIDGDYTNSFNHDDFCEMVKENITGCAKQYDFDFIRVVEAIKIEYNRSEYVVPELQLVKIKDI